VGEQAGCEYQALTRTGSEAGGCFRRNPRSFEEFLEFLIVNGFHNDTSQERKVALGTSKEIDLNKIV
jgi:hypothetical protein